MRRIVGALAGAVCLACGASEPGSVERSGQGAELFESSTAAAESAARSADRAEAAARAAGEAAAAAGEVSGEAASLLASVGFEAERDTVQVVNTKLGNLVVFVPGTLVVTGGSGRRLSIYNDTDATHGFSIPALGVEALLTAGEETVVELPELAGGNVYDVRCHLHVPHRHAALVVLPAR